MLYGFNKDSTRAQRWLFPPKRLFWNNKIKKKNPYPTSAEQSWCRKSWAFQNFCLLPWRWKHHILHHLVQTTNIFLCFRALVHLISLIPAMSKGIFTFFEEKQLLLCRYLVLLSFNIHNFLFALFWINCFMPFPISVIIFPLPFLHPLAFFAFQALFALIPHICFCRGSCEFIYFSWEIYSVHRCSLERLVCLFIVFKVQILKSFVSRMQSQIARKYCFCVFNGAAVSCGNFIFTHSL